MAGDRTDWLAWHEAYADPGSSLSRRLHVVQGLVEDHLDRHEGAVRVVSACAGDGRDLLGVLEQRDDAARVGGRLVETDPTLVRRARARAAELGLDLEVRQEDAGTTSAYAGATPADLVLLCGVFGNVTDDDVERTVHATPGLCASGATVVWTRHRGAPDLTPRIRQWFSAAGFSELGWYAPDDDEVGVGAHRYDGDPVALEPGQPLFTFLR
jgi:hypothetical protein